MNADDDPRTRAREPVRWIDRLDELGDLSLPGDPSNGVTEAEWSEIAALDDGRVEEAARISGEVFPLWVHAESRSGETAAALKRINDRITQFVVGAEQVQATDRVWEGLTHDEQVRCVARAADELHRLPSVNTAKHWLSVQIAANAYEAIKAFGGGDVRMSFARSGSPALAWLGALRVVGETLSAPGQAAKTFGFAKRRLF